MHEPTFAIQVCGDHGAGTRETRNECAVCIVAARVNAALSVLHTRWQDYATYLTAARESTDAGNDGLRATIAAQDVVIGRQQDRLREQSEYIHGLEAKTIRLARELAWAKTGGR